FGATFGIAVGLGRTPPPPVLTEPSPVEVAIGYDFAGPPTLARVLFDWRFDLIFGTAAILLAVLYVLGVRRLRRAATGGPWVARWRGFAAARRCSSPRRRDWAAICLRCFRCT